MAKAKKLKVFRTPIGFHDAFVAAPSQKAALEAWGAESNLFAAGVAEPVTDPALMDAPLARPGEVVRVLRGSAAEQIAALGRSEKKKADRPSPGPSRKRERGKRAPSRAPRPSRTKVDKAEAGLAKVEARHRREVEKLLAEEAALLRKRRATERRQRGEREALSKAVDAAHERYRAALAEWGG